MAAFGHGQDYKYPHEFAGNWVEEEYLPDPLQGQRFFEPGAEGFERTLQQRLAEVEERRKKAAAETNELGEPMPDSR